MVRIVYGRRKAEKLLITAIFFFFFLKEIFTTEIITIFYSMVFEKKKKCFIVLHPTYKYCTRMFSSRELYVLTAGKKSRLVFHSFRGKKKINKNLIYGTTFWIYIKRIRSTFFYATVIFRLSKSCVHVMRHTPHTRTTHVSNNKPNNKYFFSEILMEYTFHVKKKKIVIIRIKIPQNIIYC